MQKNATPPLKFLILAKTLVYNIDLKSKLAQEIKFEAFQSRNLKTTRIQNFNRLVSNLFKKWKSHIIMVNFIFCATQKLRDQLN